MTSQITGILAYSARKLLFEIQEAASHPENQQLGSVISFGRAIQDIVQKKLKDCRSPLELENVQKDMNTAQHILALNWNWNVLNFIKPGEFPVKFNASLGRSSVTMTGYYDTITPGSPYHFSYQPVYARLNYPSDVIPPEVKQAVGNTQNVEFILNIESLDSITEVMLDQKQPFVFNLVTHPWLFENYIPGSDVTKDVEMGIFQPNGVYEVRTQDGIPFNAMKPIPVICHPNHQGLTAFSPNNCHFGVSGDQIFSSFWSVLKVDGKALVKFNILFHTADDSTRPSLKALSMGFDKMPGIKAAKPGSTQALLDMEQAFAAGEKDFAKFGLSVLHENALYYMAWKKKWDNQNPGKPAPHADFGRAAFHGWNNLPQQYHFSPEERAALVRNYRINLGIKYQGLVQQIEKILGWNELSDKIQTLKPVYEAFRSGDLNQGLQLFERIQGAYKGAIQKAVWEMFGRPMNFAGDFGAASFYGDSRLALEQRCTNEKRAEAILNAMYNP